MIDLEKGYSQEKIIINKEEFQNSIEVKDNIPYRFKIALKNIDIVNSQ